ncbi:MAG TPA: monooxygenase [Sneathiellales bacterium]|nr:monooxygenase [Sneathiellales bacterium]
MNAKRDILVVGGGICGLTVSIALKKKGMNPRIVEIQENWHPVSSGIFLNSNALRALRRVDVLDEIVAAGWGSEGDKMAIFDQDGNHLTDVTYPRLAGPDVPAVLGLKRMELHNVLVKKTIAEDIPITKGTTIESFTEDADKIKATLTDGTTADYDLMIGADGIRSKVRAIAFDGVEPEFSSFGTWRCVCDRPKDLTTKIMMMGVGKRLGIMPISGDKLYVFATSREIGNPWYEKSSWYTTMKEKFSEFKGYAPELFAQSQSADDVVYAAVEEVKQPAPWHMGRVVILGDAAHASTPYLSQGAAMGIEDCIVLAELAAKSGPFLDNIHECTDRRYERCKFVQENSRAVGERGAVEDVDYCIERNKAVPQHAQAENDRIYEVISREIYEFED